MNTLKKRAPTKPTKPRARGPTVKFFSKITPPSEVDSTARWRRVMHARARNGVARVSCRRASTYARTIGASRAAIRARGHGDSAMSEDDDYAMDENRTPYYTQTERKFLDLITVQALKNVLHYLQESNGEMHMYLHNYISENPIQLGDSHSMEDWLTGLAARPLTRVNDPRRSSVPGPAAEEAALRGGREISPRDLVERICAARVHVAQELGGVSEKLSVRNNSIFTNALATTFKLSDDDV